MRIALYVDGPYRRTAAGVAPDPADAPFLAFAGEVAARFARRRLLARVEPGDGDPRFALPPDVEIAALPAFGDLRRVGRVAAASLGTVRAMWRALDDVDAVWAFGPHPFAAALALMGIARRRRVVLGIRQDSSEYFRSRDAGGRWSPAALASRVTSGVFGLISRRTSVTAVGDRIAAAHGGPSDRVLTMTVSLVRDQDLAGAADGRDWDAPRIDLLTVGRVDREKNPLLAVDTLALLDREWPGRVRWTWIGAGPMTRELRDYARRRGVQHLLVLPGFVPFGPELLDRYREAHAFVHVSLTEGVPAVLMEAMGAGLPVVATDVGGVRAALEGGAAGLLVPPDDADALAAAIRRLRDEPWERAARAGRGLALAREHTLEREAARVAGFIRPTYPPRRRAGRRLS